MLWSYIFYVCVILRCNFHIQYHSTNVSSFINDSNTDIGLCEFGWALKGNKGYINRKETCVKASSGCLHSSLLK